METLFGLAGAIRSGNPEFKTVYMHTGIKRRCVDVPNAAMREIHQYVIARLARVANKKEVLQSSYGCLSGKSTVSNALSHMGNRYVYQLDIKSAYSSVALGAMADALAELDSSLGDWFEIEGFLKGYCKGSEGGLALGAPASPALFDLYCAIKIDRSIRALLKEATYTRYFDDLTISSKRPLPTIIRRKIRQIVAGAGFSVSHHKSKVRDLTRGTITITGIALTRQNRLCPSDSFMKKVGELLKRPCTTPFEDIHVLQGCLGHLGQLRAACPRLLLSHEVKRLEGQIRTRIQEIRRIHKLAEPLRLHARISKTTIEQVVQKVSLVDLVGARVKLKKVGRNYFGLCPVHKEKSSSFSVNEQKKFFHCFGCGFHGDSIRFVTDVLDMDFKSAVRYLQERYNL